MVGQRPLDVFAISVIVQQSVFWWPSASGLLACVQHILIVGVMVVAVEMYVYAYD